MHLTAPAFGKHCDALVDAGEQSVLHVAELQTLLRSYLVRKLLHPSICAPDLRSPSMSFVALPLHVGE